MAPPKSAPAPPPYPGRDVTMAPPKSAPAPPPYPDRDATMAPLAPAPKRKINPYALFVKLNWKTIKLLNPELTFTAMSKKVAEMWNGLTEEQKKTYTELAKEDKELVS
eukprot:TRINITY_DN1308_c1_g1_i1.p1 TRINITY_DN1308_c1_g1~~TRINITY_DN1308_c1_g1_i1.p1  ORF type:complete len:120 (+),score=8.29 TRINITY_DN1308_c1_g1_i1:38-361(+)